MLMVTFRSGVKTLKAPDVMLSILRTLEDWIFHSTIITNFEHYSNHRS